jgi:transcriptional regulator with GAF, ATPase, and Fis domain/tetratricopeptide (TPR) repeat protein
MPFSKSQFKANIDEEAFQIEKNLAENALTSGDRTAAWHHLFNLVSRLRNNPETDESRTLLISASIKLANVSFVLGKGFSELVDILQNARIAAGKTGDRRSRAMINLHLGRLFYFAEKREEAMSVFELGKTEVEQLGDEDILTQAAEFIGLYYFIQGRFTEAINYFEHASQSFEFETQRRVINPSGPVWLSYSAAFLGQFHRAIGTLDYYRRVAIESGDNGLATTLRAVLGIILLGIKKNKEAHFHLSGALQEAVSTQNILASYFAKGGLSVHHFMEGRTQLAWEWIGQNLEEGAAAGLIHQYASPIVLEALYEFHQSGMSKIGPLTYAGEFKRIMREPNVHLKGVALRLKALEMVVNGDDISAIELALLRSEDYLKQSGDPVQLGKTYVEMARLQLLSGNLDEARKLADNARKGFGSYMDVFFPDDLRQLLTVKSDLKVHRDSGEHLLGMFSDVIQELSPSADFDFLLSRTVKATNRFFGAERGCIFWFSRRGTKKAPVLRGPCNLSETDISADDFKDSFSLVFKAYHENQPKVFRQEAFRMNPSNVKAMLCVPFEVAGNVRGVLYHDNSYVQDCFNDFDTDQLKQMAQWLTSYIDHIFEFSRRMEKKTSDQLGQLELTDEQSIITQSRIMKKTLDQTDHIASTDSSVLILGETGVGKELLAKRIHQMSKRQNSPLVIIDPTVIPENLVESELFGHEKGAFTGADRQKKGRIELAHKGTLFIDEVGEIPKSIQVKLLRAIQEKTMMRVGGTKSIFSDFRLIAATNRDLAREVAAGRFREDLYYRLNVIPIELPPLRERGEDILILARHFIERFSLKYNCPGLILTPDHESILTEYNWPGNIRELQNVIERAVLLSTGGTLNLNLPSEKALPEDSQFEDLPSLDEIQRRYIRYVMKKTGGKISGPGGATEILAIKRTSLYNRMKKLGLR